MAVESRTRALITQDTPLPGAPMVGSLGEQAFVEVRAPLVEAVLRRITAPGRIGAAVLGEEGSGRTAVLRAVAHQASRTHHVVRIWASKRASSEPYRAIAFLLAELEPEDTRHPLTIIQGVRAFLEEQSDGRPVILAIDNAGHLDAASAMVISRLVVAGATSVLVAAESLRTMENSFSDLWRDGDLECFELPALTRRQIRSIAEAALGAPVSPDAVEVLERSSEGNARYLHAALEDLQYQGIEPLGGAWVATTDRVPVPSAVRTRTRAILDGLHEREQEIVRILAFAGSLPVVAVRRLASGTGGSAPSSFDPDAEAAHLDALHPLIRTSTSGGASAVSLCSALVAAAVREQTTAQEAASLYALLVGSAAAPRPAAVVGRSELEPLWHADWLLAAGLPVPADLALLAARRCAFLGLHERAIFWASLHADEDPERLLLAAGSSLDLGHGDQAEALVAQGMAVQETAPVAVLVALLLLRSRASRLGGGLPAERSALLDDADGHLERAGLHPATAVAERQLRECRGHVTLERAENAGFAGDYLAVIRLLQNADRTGWTPDQEALGDGLLCEALALTDQQLDAVVLAVALRGHLDESVHSRQVLDAARLRIAVAQYAAGIAGDPDVPASRPATDAAAPLPALGQDALQDFVAGMRAALQGRFDQARALLLPVTCQLGLQDQHGLLPLASAALVHSHTAIGMGDSAVGRLPAVEAGPPSSWLATAVVGHLRAVSAGHHDPRSETAARLRLLADTAETQGVPLLAMMHRLAEVRSGNRRASTALGTAAARVEGVYGITCELYAKAVGASDPELFAQAMESAEAAGDTRLSRECAVQALETAQLTGARGVLRDIQRRAGRLFGNTTDMELGAALERLTRREREVAQLAAGGQTNKVIAVTLGVTTRTVEGHLYQIFTKLHLQSRTELTDLVQAGAR